MKEVSIVMPAYNEEKNIEDTIRKCSRVLESEKLNGEIVVVEDGSKDSTKEVLENLKKDIPYLRVIIHETNLGYGKAVSDGIKAARGVYIVTLDSDGQFDINELPLFLEKIKEGYNMVTGYRLRKKDTFTKVLAIGGVVSGGMIAVSVLLMVKNAKKKGNRKPEYSIPVNWFIIGLLSLIFIAGIVFEILNSL